MMQELKKKKNPMNCAEVMNQKNMSDHNTITFVSLLIWWKFILSYRLPRQV